MKRVLTLTALLALATLGMPAYGAIVLDFGTGLALPGGNFKQIGINGVGSGIPIGSLTVSGAGMYNGVYSVTDAANDLGSAGSLDFDTGVTSNFIHITGTVAQCVLGACLTAAPPPAVPVSGTLLSGSFNGWLADGNGLHDATGPDTKLDTLLAALGIPADTHWGFFGFSITTNGLGNTPGGDEVTSTDIRNTSVPEPSSIILFGAVLLSCSVLIRRRRTMVG